MSIAPASSPYDAQMHNAILQANADYGVSIPENVFRQLIFSESSFNPAAGTGKPYAGLGGLGDAAIKDIKGPGANTQAIQYDPNASIDVAAQYLAKLVRDKGSLRAGLVAYKGFGGTESQNLADQVLSDAGYAGISQDTSWWDKYIKPAAQAKTPTSAQGNQGEQTAQTKPTEWGTIQRYAASAAALVLGVGLLLVVTGKETLNSLSKKAIA